MNIAFVVSIINSSPAALRLTFYVFVLGIAKPGVLNRML